MEITVVVSGQSVTATARKSENVAALCLRVLEQSGNVGQPASEWELRTVEGRLLEQTITVGNAGIVAGNTLYLSPHAGMGANEQYDGEDAALCAFCGETFSTEADKCLTKAHARIASLESALAEKQKECQELTKSLVIVDHLRIENLSRADKAESALAERERECETWKKRCDLLKEHYEEKMHNGERVTTIEARAESAEKALAAAREENERLRNLPAVGGSYVEGTLNGLAYRAQVHLGMEQEKPLPDNALIAVLCDVVRLIREWDRRVEVGVFAALRSRDEGRVERVARLLPALQWGEQSEMCDWEAKDEEDREVWRYEARKLLGAADEV